MAFKNGSFSVNRAYVASHCYGKIKNWAYILSINVPHKYHGGCLAKSYKTEIQYIVPNLNGFKTRVFSKSYN